MKFKNKLSGFLQCGLEGQNPNLDINFFGWKMASLNYHQKTHLKKVPLKKRYQKSKHKKSYLI